MRQVNKIFMGLSLLLLAFAGYSESNNQFVTNNKLNSQMEYSKTQIAEAYINARMRASKHSFARGSTKPAVVVCGYNGFARGSTKPTVVVCDDNSGVRKTANGHGR